MCGEHRIVVHGRAVRVGSSPHVRGALHPHAGKVGKRGIIPACAGSTHRRTPCRPSHRDHPRMCGEHAFRQDADARRTGSSPHVRGALDVLDGRHPDRGIIPACAGSTPHPRSKSPLPWDHPRMCGEHGTTSGTVCRPAGSSPHVRGAPHGSGLPGTGRGIIPACAGSTYSATILREAKRDHPRMCGEHTFHRCSHPPSSGSSPHVRGALIGLVAVHPLPGIIPACAGSTD